MSRFTISDRIRWWSLSRNIIIYHLKNQQQNMACGPHTLPKWVSWSQRSHVALRLYVRSISCPSLSAGVLCNPMGIMTVTFFFYWHLFQRVVSLFEEVNSVAPPGLHPVALYHQSMQLISSVLDCILHPVYSFLVYSDHSSKHLINAKCFACIISFNLHKNSRGWVPFLVSIL